MALSAAIDRMDPRVAVARDLHAARSILAVFGDESWVFSHNPSPLGRMSAHGAVRGVVAREAPGLGPALTCRFLTSDR